MFKGIAFALGACFIWGLIFVIPQFMGDFSSLEIALGRYAVFGLVSSLIFFKAKTQGLCLYPKPIWVKALWFTLVYTIGYYTFVVLALRYATPAICALVLGISPITIAFYGNWKQKEISNKKLLLPSFLILLGLTIINVPHMQNNPSPTTYLWGLACAFISLIAWSWYVVANPRFMKQNPNVSSSDWSTLIGVASIFWVVVFAIVLALFFPSQLHLQKYVTLNEELARFLIGSTILGLLCAWVGAYLWNKASLHLPVSLAGQLTIFETIFGVVFVYLIQQNLPPALECLGMILLLIAIILGVRQFAKDENTVPTSLLRNESDNANG